MVVIVNELVAGCQSPTEVIFDKEEKGSMCIVQHGLCHCRAVDRVSFKNAPLRGHVLIDTVVDRRLNRAPAIDHQGVALENEAKVLATHVQPAKVRLSCMFELVITMDFIV